MVTQSIVALNVDTVVSSTDPTLLAGGGVAGVILSDAGPELFAHCARLPELAPGVRCRPGAALLTPGYQLRAKHVIHTVGPQWSSGKQDELDTLANCYRSALRLAGLVGAASIAFPAISCGSGGFPAQDAAAIALYTLRDELAHHPSIEVVHLVSFTPSEHSAFQLAAAGGSGEFSRN